MLLYRPASITASFSSITLSGDDLCVGGASVAPDKSVTELREKGTKSDRVGRASVVDDGEFALNWKGSDCVDGEFVSVGEEIV